MDELQDLDQVEAEAVLAGDVVRLEQVWHDEYIVNNPFNTVVDRAEVLVLVRGGQIAYRSFERTTEAVRLIGDTGVRMGEAVVVPADGAPSEGQTVVRRYTHIWLRGDSGWRLAARHASVVNSTPL
jgi:ketosteroid isomerase-like protein